jgi:hypothetical protein
MRKTICAVAAVLALGAATMTGAMAAPFSGHGAATAGAAHMGAAPGGGARFGGAPAIGGSNFGTARIGAGPAVSGRVATANPAFNHGGNFRHGWHGGWGGLYAFGGSWIGPDYNDYGYDSCWQRRLVPTPFGLRWRLVNVCY